MAPLYAFLAFAFGSYLSEALWQSTKPKKRPVQLAETSGITEGSQRVMEELATQVSSLQDRLNQVNQKGKDSLQTQKTSFEQTLADQTHENIRLRSQSEAIIMEIQSHRSNSSKWRRQAEHMALACDRLKQELSQLHANMTLAQEFIHQTLNTTTNMLEAPELRILEELTQQDEADKKERLHSSYLMEIAGDHADGIQMLQVNGSVTEAPQDLLQSLMASIEDLSKHQNQSLSKMKANFDVAYQRGVEARKALLDEQAKLNATRTYERRLDDLLHQAADHLSKTHNELTHRLGALRVFHARLGGDSATSVHRDAISLLQIGQTILPETSSLMREPQQVHEKLKSHIAMLAAGLAEKQQKANEAIERLKADYESQLNSQAGENEKMQRKNKILAEYANELGRSNRALREEAKMLEAENAQLEADLKNLKLNISTANEFVRMAVESSNEMLWNASELSVLDSLDARDAAARSVRIHQERLEQVRKSPSLLQLSAAGVISPKDTHEVLESLMASLTDLSQEQNVSEASLKASFEEEFNIGRKKHLSLEEDQTSLNNTIADREALRERLRAAVHHLQAQRDRLLESIHSLRSYMKSMGYAQDPNRSISLLSVEPQERHDSQIAVKEGKGETSEAERKMEQRKQLKEATPRNEQLFTNAVEQHHVEPQERHDSQITVKEGKGETSEAVRKMEKRKQLKQATPRNEQLFTNAIEQHHVSQEDRGQGKRKIAKDDNEAKRKKHAKHAKLERRTKANEKELAENGTEARVVSGTPRWLAPVEKGINWLMR